MKVYLLEIIYTRAPYWEMAYKEYFAGTYKMGGECLPSTTKEPMKAKHYSSKSLAKRGAKALGKKINTDFHIEVVEMEVSTK